MSKEQFVGTWQLIDAQARLANGKVLHPYGQNPAGMLIYDANGHMSVQLMDADRQTFAVADKSRGTVEEMKAAIEKYEAYFGTYDIDEEGKVVRHHASGSLLPNWTGTDQVRFYEFSGNRLTLSTAEIPYSGTTLVGRLTWERVG
ncbi:MAG TPA: lipocalin-like domain-containing protein [Anaerolineae bacterium]